ncbi:hypothetical protein JYG23_00175 [Sedimentibacter sp. zth1]|uniref:hypothetical protein n=1 Tax=Sedimentibacter sp. zth1 TaxID=2816908 RepID=UPI001A916615|nr:hypothetical protein [Sedimentibacter sp. zth1]QSX05922.1 hypothetical protein JYG23_00175 [Sedimentibacter sp. zth1]
MKKLKVLYIILSSIIVILIIMLLYSQKNIKQLKEEIEEYRAENEQYLKIDKEFTYISELISKFYISKNNEDIDKVNSLLDANFIVIEDENIILKKDGSKEYILLDKKRNLNYKGMTILSINYIKEKCAYFVNTQEFIFYEDGTPFEHALFINFLVKEESKGWRIIDVNFDI